MAVGMHVSMHMHMHCMHMHMHMHMHVHVPCALHAHCMRTASTRHPHGIHTASTRHVHVHRSFWVLIALAVPILALPLALLGPPSAQGAAERETTAFLQETLAVTLTNPEPNLQP